MLSSSSSSSSTLSPNHSYLGSHCITRCITHTTTIHPSIHRRRSFILSPGEHILLHFLLNIQLIATCTHTHFHLKTILLRTHAKYACLAELPSYHGHHLDLFNDVFYADSLFEEDRFRMIIRGDFSVFVAFLSR